MNYDNIYFLGIGGIGMSAIARFFLHEGKRVAGYDRSITPLTEQLSNEGAEIHYMDDPEMISPPFRDPERTLVVYTPAIPETNTEFRWLRAKGFRMEKRSQMLEDITSGKYVMAVAGTHGKTTTTTLVAWLNQAAAKGGRDEMSGRENPGGEGPGSAFLGGISKNFGSNLVLGRGRRIAVEADEYDRSFLRLHPDAAIITAADPDHLDIYGTYEKLKEAFAQFVRQIKPGGTLILKQGAQVEVDNQGIKVYRYSFDDPAADFHARGVRLREDSLYDFDIVCPDRVIEGCMLGVPGWVNVENAVGAAAMMWAAGFDEDKLRQGLASFKGIKRRLEVLVNMPGFALIDDYAHHPRELAAAIGSIREMFPGRRITAVFQPHLFTRTRDFYEGFAQSLSMADQVILLPIYPARELPIEGITTEIIADRVTVPCRLVHKEELMKEVAASEPDVLAVFGAGDIDVYPEQIARRFGEGK